MKKKTPDKPFFKAKKSAIPLNAKSKPVRINISTGYRARIKQGRR